MALVTGWFATIMSKFSQDDGVPDTLHDTIGTLGRAICAQPYFNAEAFRLKAELIKCLSAQRYTGFTANVTNYGSWGVGVSRLYFVPKDRRGALSSYREQTIRLICVGSGRYTRELMAGKIETTEDHQQKIKEMWLKNQTILKLNRKQALKKMRRLGEILLQRIKRAPDEAAQLLSLQQEAENTSIASLTSAQMRQLAKLVGIR